LSVLFSEIKDVGIPPEVVSCEVVDGSVVFEDDSSEEDEGNDDGQTNDDSNNQGSNGNTGSSISNEGGEDDNETDFIAPTADAGGPYETYLVGESIIFDGSNSDDSDGEIVNWTWNLNDGSIKYGETIEHSFSSPNTYEVTLTVTDNDQLKATDEVMISISIGNNPPVIQTINGVTHGQKNTSYQYNFSATDPDQNDTIRYVVNWGDTTTTSSFMNTSQPYQTEHSWDIYGIYNIEVYAENNDNTRSKTKTMTVYIDVQPIEEGINGYLFNSDDNRLYDGFYNVTSKTEGSIKTRSDGTILIDDNDDEQWDYVYNVSTGKLLPYNSDDINQNFWSILGLILVLLFILLAIFFYNQKNKNKKKVSKNQNAKKEPKKQSKKSKKK